MKRTKHCPKCQSVRVGHLAWQVDIDERIRDSEGGPPNLPARSRHAAGRYAGVHTDVIDGAFWGKGEYRELVGQLEAYVCTACGYYETFVTTPQSIEWDKVAGFSWVNSEPPSGGPFR